MNKNERYIQMTETKIEKLIPKLAIPTIISMLITTLYNMADTYFVSQLADPAASAAVGVIFSLTTVIQTLGLTMGIGASNAISMALGNKEEEMAKRYLSTAFYSMCAMGILCGVLGLMFIDPLVYALGASETIAPYAAQYARYILLATPFMATSFVLNATLRSQGNALYGMIGLTTGGIINIILDPIFIFGLDLGIAGAAIATGISQFISFCLLFFQGQYRKNSIRIQLRYVTPQFKIYKRIFTLGFPTFCRLSLATIASILVNVMARPFGDFAITAIGIVNRIVMFMNAFLIGYGQGFQPVAGFNFGASKYKRVLEAYRFSIKLGLLITCTTGTIGFLFAENIVALFRNEPQIIAMGSLMLRLQCVTLPLQSITILSNMLTQSIGYSFQGTLIAMSRQGLFFIPIIWLAPQALGVFGIQIAQPLSDIFAVILAGIIVRGVVKQLQHLQQQQIQIDEQLAEAERVS